MEIVKDEVIEIKENPSVDVVTEQKAPEYDPNKKYTWKPTDVFYLSGNEFGILLNSFRAILSTPEARTILLTERANDVIEDTLARAVQAGIVEEAKQEEKK
jgi:hypothetical protein